MWGSGASSSGCGRSLLIASRLLFDSPTHSWFTFLILCTITCSSWFVCGKFDFNISFNQVDSTTLVILSFTIIITIELDTSWCSIFALGPLGVGLRVSIRHLELSRRRRWMLFLHWLAASPTFLIHRFWWALWPVLLIAFRISIRLRGALARCFITSSWAFIMNRSKVRLILEQRSLLSNTLNIIVLWLVLRFWH